MELPRHQRGDEYAGSDSAATRSASRATATGDLVMGRVVVHSQGGRPPEWFPQSTFAKPRVEMVTDGMSNTLCMVESAGSPQVWKKGKRTGDRPPGFTDTLAQQSIYVYSFQDDGTPVNLGVGACAINYNNYQGIYSLYPVGANAVFMDGSVRFLRE